MSDVEFTALDHRGIDYVRRQLTGVNLLCTELLEAMARFPGMAFTLSPAGTTAEQLYDFENGGMLPPNLDITRAVRSPENQGSFMPVESLSADRVVGIRTLMRQSPETVCIVDDVTPRWEEIRIDETPTAFGVDCEVYHLLTSTDDDETFLKIIQSADALWHGVAVVCERAPLIDNQRLTNAAELRKCADSVIEITCTAFDGEGFVGWRRGVV